MIALKERTKGLNNNPSGFCPGCNHSTLTKIIVEVLDEMNLLGEAITVLPIGCATLNCANIMTDVIMSAHGRAPAVATGVKRALPDKIVYTYQGDGDLASIGLSEILFAANRGEKFCTFFINNGIYGMTGGQMAPTTPIGEPSTTGGKARNPEETGYPIKMCEVIDQLEAPVFIGRYSLDSVVNIRKAKEAIRKAFQYQLDGRGYCFLEFLCACPTNWKLKPLDAVKHIREKVIPVFPVGVVRDKVGEE